MDKYSRRSVLREVTHSMELLRACTHTHGPLAYVHTCEWTRGMAGMTE
jgi:hypothetical protein